MCLGLQLWVSTVVKVWLRYVVPRHDQHVVNFTEKRVITPTIWDMLCFMEHETSSLSHVFGIFKSGSRTVNFSFPPPSFLHTSKAQFGDHFTTTCGDLFCNFFSKTLLNEPCSPKSILQLSVMSLVCGQRFGQCSRDVGGAIEDYWSDADSVVLGRTAVVWNVS